MLMTMVTLFMILGLVALLGVSTYAVMQYLQEEQMEKVPVRVKDEHHIRR